MADRNPGQAGIEAMLTDLGRHLDLPAAADPVPGVLARLASPEPPRVPWWQRPRRMALAAAVAVLALLVGLTPAGQAVASRVLDAFGVVLRLGSPQAPDRPERLPGETPVTGSSAGTGTPRGPSSSALERARAQVRFRVVVPDTLGVPDQVLVSDGGRVLSLVYRAGPGRPAPGAGGVSARLDEFDGGVEPVFYKTLGVSAEFVELPGGGSAVWIEQPHDVVYVGADGRPRTGSAHLASRTLIWEVGGVTLRLEGDFTREQAVAAATSTLPTTP